jgi:hypothetical protein
MHASKREFRHRHAVLDTITPSLKIGKSTVPMELMFARYESTSTERQQPVLGLDRQSDGTSAHW